MSFLTSDLVLLNPPVKRRHARQNKDIILCVESSPCMSVRAYRSMSSERTSTRKRSSSRSRTRLLHCTLSCAKSGSPM